MEEGGMMWLVGHGKYGLRHFTICVGFSGLGWTSHSDNAVLMEKRVLKSWTTGLCVNGSQRHKYQTLTDYSNHISISVQWAVCVSLQGSATFTHVFTKVVACSQQSPVSSGAGEQGTCAHVDTRMRAYRDWRMQHTCTHACAQGLMDAARVHACARTGSLQGGAGAGSQRFLSEVSLLSQRGKPFELEETQRWFSSLTMFLRKQEWGAGKWNDLAKVT